MNKVFIKLNGNYILDFELHFEHFNLGFTSNIMLAYNFKNFSCANNFLCFMNSLQPGFSDLCEVVF